MDVAFRRWSRAALGASFALMSVFLLTGCPPDGPQGWNDADRTFFYYTSQGSRLIRRDWFLALEREDSQDLFLADGLKRFGYLPGETVGDVNTDKLPIGFAVDPPKSPEWIGLTCAACHTSEISYNGKTGRVDGAPASADMFEFLFKLDLALQKAANDDAAFLRFAERALGANNTPANRAVLRDDASPDKGIRAFSAQFKGFVADSTPTAPLKSGPARIDAFNMIFNRVTSINLGIPGNNRPPNAPVSYPFLWGTSWHDVTQWNGAVRNSTAIYRLARNAGQVLGVFGKVDVSRGPPYSSSVQLHNLLELDKRVGKLTAPEWPDAVLGKPDPDLVREGAQAYKDWHCAGCHEVVAKDDQYRSVVAKKVPATVLRTDPAMTNIAATRRADTGMLRGRQLDPVPLTRPTRLIEQNELVQELLQHMVLGVVSPILLQVPHDQLQTLFDPSLFIRNYKARPLNGIWATGPYLHNGSVRTLYQMLLPSSAAVAQQFGLDPNNVRETKFHVGSREFDPKQVGFINAAGVVAFELDTSVPGNSNSGHDHSVQMPDRARWAIVEYLKTL